jgi:hypothetical protein
MKRFLRAFAAEPLAAKIWPHVHTGSIEVTSLPPEILRLASRSYDEVKRDTEKVIREAIRKRLARHRALTGAPPLGRAKGLEKKELDFADTSYDLDMVAGWRFVFEEIFKKPFRPLSTSRHFDYQLNLGALNDISTLLEGSQVDEKTGRVVFDWARPRNPESYDDDRGYFCPRSGASGW